jgi:putative intracellular protease/amidase
MRTSIVVWLVVFTIAQAFPLGSNAETKKVLLIPREGSADLEMALTKEAGIMAAMLRDAGYEVVVATVSGKSLSTKNSVLKPDMKLADVNVSDYMGIIMPCMNAGENLARPPKAIEIVKTAASLGIPIAAQRGSVLILNDAGIRDYNKIAALSKDNERRLGGTGVFQDGNILTSGICPYYAMETGKPDGTVELTSAFIRVLESRATSPGAN